MVGINNIQRKTGVIYLHMVWYSVIVGTIKHGSRTKGKEATCL